MPDRLEDRIRRGAENMYEASTPAEDLIPSELAERAGQPIPVPAVTRLRPPRRRLPRRRWLVGLAAAAALLLISVPVLFLLEGPDQEPATSDVPSVDRNLTALFEGEAERVHYRISVLAAPSAEAQPSLTNSNVEVEVFADPSDTDPIFECFAPEKTLETSSIEINPNLATGSFEGEYKNSPCFFGDVTFDLDWTGRGNLINEEAPSDEAGEICRDLYEAVANGTMQFSSGPITQPITVKSTEATIVISEEARCLTPDSP